MRRSVVETFAREDADHIGFAILIRAGAHRRFVALIVSELRLLR
jgi:hypothetical protein